VEHTPKETFNCYAAAASASAVAAVAICLQVLTDPSFHVNAHCPISELTYSGITPIILSFFPSSVQYWQKFSKSVLLKCISWGWVSKNISVQIFICPKF
jgi:hypothetical protein